MSDEDFERGREKTKAHIERATRYDVEERTFYNGQPGFTYPWHKVGSIALADSWSVMDLKKRDELAGQIDAVVEFAASEAVKAALERIRQDNPDLPHLANAQIDFILGRLDA